MGIKMENDLRSITGGSVATVKKAFEPFASILFEALKKLKEQQNTPQTPYGSILGPIPLRSRGRYGFEGKMRRVG